MDLIPSLSMGDLFPFIGLTALTLWMLWGERAARVMGKPKPEGLDL